MENTLMSWDKKQPFINELTQGRDLAKQLKIHFIGQSSSSLSTAEILITERVISSFDKALNLMVNWEKSKGGSTEDTMSPHSMIGGGSTSSHDYNSSDLIIRENANRRRKKLPRWTDKVRIGLETGFLGPPDDGYDWRKYGQKDILGANYPRSYYRCSNRDVQGCKAIKQVQRSNEDPSIFCITYEGRHSCIQVSDLDIMDEPQNSSPSYNQFRREHNHLQADKKREQKKQKRSHETVLNFQTAAAGYSPSQVKNKDSDHIQDELITTCSLFSLYPSTSIIDHLGNENPFFSSSMLLDSNFNIMAGSFSSPPYMSPSIESESNYFSASNSPISDIVFSLDEVDFQTNFLLDSPRIFS